jgi:hypothetical protein
MAKRRIMKTQIFSACKNIIIFKKSPLKETQNPSRYYYNSILTKSQVSPQAKKDHFSKKYSYKNRPIIIT